MTKKVRKIFKYATGDVIPEGAIYLNTVTQVMEPRKDDDNGNETSKTRWVNCWYVWHYYSVEVDK